MLRFNAHIIGFDEFDMPFHRRANPDAQHARLVICCVGGVVASMIMMAFISQNKVSVTDEFEMPLRQTLFSYNCHSWKFAEVTFSPASLSALFPEITSLLSSSFTSTAQFWFLTFVIVYTPVERVMMGRRSSWLEGSARAWISRIRHGAWKREDLASSMWPLESLWGKMMDRIQEEQEQPSRGIMHLFSRVKCSGKVSGWPYLVTLWKRRTWAVNSSRRVPSNKFKNNRETRVIFQIFHDLLHNMTNVLKLHGRIENDHSIPRPPSGHSITCPPRRDSSVPSLRSSNSAIWAR